MFSFCHSNFSSSSKNLCGSGLSKLQRQHHMKTYCETDGCIVECSRSLFNIHGHKKHSCVASAICPCVQFHLTLLSPRHPTHPIMMHWRIASSMCPRTQETQLRSIHHLSMCVQVHRSSPSPPHPTVQCAENTTAT